MYYVGSSSVLSSVAVAALIPSLVSLALLISLTVVTVWLCRNIQDLKRSYQLDGRRTCHEIIGEEVIYDTVKETVAMATENTSPPNTNEDIAYGGRENIPPSEMETTGNVAMVTECLLMKPLLQLSCIWKRMLLMAIVWLVTTFLLQRWRQLIILFM